MWPTLAALTLQPRPAVGDVECWDDDGDLVVDDLQFAAKVSRAGLKSARPHDAFPSKMSIKSETESVTATDEERQVVLPADDEQSKTTAIASAISAGVPIPQNVPASALMGGSIKRLGTKKSRTLVGVDWSDDLELPGSNAVNLKIKKPNEGDFPDTLPDIVGGTSMVPPMTHRRFMAPPVVPPASHELSMGEFCREHMKATRRRQLGLSPVPAARPRPIDLDLYRDGKADASNMVEDTDDVPTIRPTKARTAHKPIPSFLPPISSTIDHHPTPSTPEDDFENDFELPANDSPLKLSTRREGFRTPAMLAVDDCDEWAEGSLGTRHGGTRRDGRSPKGSSISPISPSLSSSFTVESEDEGLGGIILPEGPLDLNSLLRKRQQTASPVSAEASSEKPVPTVVPTAASIPEPADAKEDFFAGIEIGNGAVFDAAKLSINRNIKHTVARGTSPARRTAVTLTFTNKTNLPPSRIPRLVGKSDRVSRPLEPVLESGGRLPTTRRPPSRLTTNQTSLQPASNIPVSALSAHVSNMSVPPPPPPPPPPAGRNRELRTRHFPAAPKHEPTTTRSQLLKSKRSMPAMRTTHHPLQGHAISKIPSTTTNRAVVRPSSSGRGAQRPSSSGRGAQRPSSSGRGAQGLSARSKSPAEKTGIDARLAQPRKTFVPFLPAGTSTSQSHHVSSKTSRNFRRQNSQSSIKSTDMPTRAGSRAGNTSLTDRSRSPRRKDVAPAALVREAASKITLLKPAKPQFLGDGSELDIFDDLPTSSTHESKFVKPPVGRGAPRSMRNKPAGPVPAPSAAPPAAPPALRPIETSAVVTGTVPVGPSKPAAQMPRFARDTQSSRIAREQRIGAAGSAVLTSFSGNNWKAHMAVRGAVGMGMGIGAGAKKAVRSKRRHASRQKKPHLIKPLGDTHHNPKSVQGMQYNPELFRWEGNENALTPFDAALPPPAHVSPVGASPAQQAPLAVKAETSDKRPALIHNINASLPAVQIVGSMVFDPKHMCWLKIRRVPVPTQAASSHAQSSLSPTTCAFTEDGGDDEEDPFAGLDDLEEGLISQRGRANQGSADAADSDDSRPSSSSSSMEQQGKSKRHKGGGGGVGLGLSTDEWLVGEEFDVGPAFIRRQREEEVRWRRKVGPWMISERYVEDDNWRWAIKHAMGYP